MARKPSVILTPTEKKELVGSHKANLKAVTAKHAEILKARATLAKEHAAFLKANEKLVASKVKELEKANKLSDKELVSLEKTASSLEQVLHGLNPPKAVASPTDAT